MSGRVWLLRHGETDWSARNRHTGRNEIPLNERGREQARRAGRLLTVASLECVYVSPQVRAVETCRLAGFGELARECDLLVEWDYGQYEGITDEQTWERRPGWNLFRDGAPGGESPGQARDRVDRMLAIVDEVDDDTLLVGHGKTLRALAARWLGRELELGAALPMDAAAICMLEREPSGPVLRLWNRTGEL